MTRRFLLVLVFLAGCGQAEPPKPVAQKTPSMEEVAAAIRGQSLDEKTAEGLLSHVPCTPDKQEADSESSTPRTMYRFPARDGYVWVEAVDYTANGMGHSFVKSTIEFSQSGKRAE